MPRYTVLLTGKLKAKPLYNLLDLFDAVQSFDHDWGFYLVDEGVVKGTYSSEKISPLPANPGAFAVLEFLVDEERAVELLGLGREAREAVTRLLDRGVPLHRAVGEAALARLISEHPSVVASALVEACIPLAKPLPKLEDRSGFDEVEVVETEYVYVEPEKVSKLLEESDYLGEYLEGLAKLFEEQGRWAEGALLLARYYVDTSLTLKEVEEHVSSRLESMGVDTLGRTLMYVRVY